MPRLSKRMGEKRKRMWGTFDGDTPMEWSFSGFQLFSARSKAIKQLANWPTPERKVRPVTVIYTVPSRAGKKSRKK